MLRNNEFKKVCIIYAVSAAAFSAVGFLISLYTGLLLLAASLCFGAIFVIFTRARYKRLAEMSEHINAALHGEDALYISECTEGELAVLQSDISKLTLRIHEQNDILKKEKAYLADSLADIAHQLRTPLTSASIIITLLKKEPDESRRRALLREAEGLFAQTDSLLTALLKLSRMDAGVIPFQNVPVSIGAVADTAINALSVSAELHNITIHTDIPSTAVINGDFTWLTEAVQNIIKNSIESAGDGGKIEISCQDTLLFTEITILDSGKGFADEDIPNLFERFYRGKSSGAAGFGIGLALCKSIIVRMGGTVTAKNAAQGGALFTIRFSK